MGRLENRAPDADIVPWVEQNARAVAVAAVDDAVAALAPHLPDEPPQLRGSARDAVAARLDAVRGARLRVLGDPVDMFLSDLIAEFSVR